MRTWSFSKGHGTENDFVTVVDRHNLLAPSTEDVTYLCDRRRGIGADGFLRAVKAEHMPEWDGEPALWFMDYRNADGSIAEMCGNGIRVFAMHLARQGLIGSTTASIATRAGVKDIEFVTPDLVRVDMSSVGRLPDSTVRHGGRDWTATGIDVGNPHAVCRVEDLDALDLTVAPGIDDAVYPKGANVEFVRVIGDHHLRMRVHERGVGETRSCGTGTVAAAAAARLWAEEEGDSRWRVDVPGGTLAIDFYQGSVYMTGPAVIVAEGEVTLPDR